MDNTKGEQEKKYGFIFEGESDNDFPKDVSPDLNDVMEAPKADAHADGRSEKKEVVHEEKLRFDGKVEDTGLSHMELEELGSDLEEEEKKPELNDELKEIAEKTPDEPMMKGMIMSEPTPEELAEMAEKNKTLEEKLTSIANSAKETMEKRVNPERHEEMAPRKRGKNMASWVYLLIAGMMGMAIGACVMVALVYGGVIGGKVTTETRTEYIVQECECEEEKEEKKDNCGPTGNYTTGNAMNCIEDEGNTTQKDNTTKTDNTTK